ncbi:TPA: hypothetical protein SLG40_003837 [Serratia odorifera]|nr:hypothetical protein [Serratia odorifera]
MTKKSNASKNTTTNIENLSALVNTLPGKADELKAKFAAGAVPLEGDYAKLIDAIYYALAALGLEPDNTSTGDGLQVNTTTNKLEVKNAGTTSGLTVNSSGIAIKTTGATSGLTVNGSGIAVDTNIIQKKLTPMEKGYINIDADNAISINSEPFGQENSNWINVVGKGQNTSSINKLNLMVKAEQFTLTSMTNTTWGHNCIELKLKNNGGIKSTQNGLEVDASVIQPKISVTRPLQLTGATVGLGLRDYGASHTDSTYANILALKPSNAEHLTLYVNTHHFTLTDSHSIATLQVNTANIQPKLTANTGISISGSTIRVNTSVIQPKLLASTGISILDNTIRVNTSIIQPKLIAGTGISISTSNSISVNTSAIQPRLIEGHGISISSNTIRVNTNVIQPKLIAGNGISISGDTINATAINQSMAARNMAILYNATHYSIGPSYIALYRNLGTTPTGESIYQVYLSVLINNKNHDIPYLLPTYKNGDFSVGNNLNQDLSSYETNGTNAIINIILGSSGGFDITNKLARVKIRYFNAVEIYWEDSTVVAI